MHIIKIKIKQIIDVYCWLVEGVEILLHWIQERMYDDDSVQALLIGNCRSRVHVDKNKQKNQKVPSNCFEQQEDIVSNVEVARWSWFLKSRHSVALRCNSFVPWLLHMWIFRSHLQVCGKLAEIFPSITLRCHGSIPPEEKGSFLFLDLKRSKKTSPIFSFILLFPVHIVSGCKSLGMRLINSF